MRSYEVRSAAALPGLASGGWNARAYRESWDYSTATSASGSIPSSRSPWTASSLPTRLTSW